jgi:hypothetical protein
MNSVAVVEAAPENEQSGLPTFEENSPNVICDNFCVYIFQLREAPFSLDINLKETI